MFRFPTRFLIVVELGLALLAALGLTRLRGDLTRRLNRTSAPCCRVHTHSRRSSSLRSARSRSSISSIHQPRQNPMVPARDWLAPPPSVAVVRADGRPQPRTFTPRHRDAASADVPARARLGGRRAVLRAARRAAAEHRRRFLERAVGGLLRRHLGRAGTSTSGAITTAKPRSCRAAWRSLDFNAQTLQVHPRSSATFWRTYRRDARAEPVPAERRRAAARRSRRIMRYVYRVDGAARVRFVRGSARRVTDGEETATRLLAADFDPDRRDLCCTTPPTRRCIRRSAKSSAAPARRPARAVITREDARRARRSTPTRRRTGSCCWPTRSIPGWTAEVDGTPAPVYRANLCGRAASSCRRGTTGPLRLRSARVSITRPADHDAVAVAADPVLRAAYADRRGRLDGAA